MADTTVQLTLPAGLTGLTLRLFAEGGDTLANTDGADALLESANAKGRYSATVTEALAGLHYALVRTSGGDALAAGWVNLADDAGTYRVGDYHAAAHLDAAVSSLGGSAPSGAHELNIVVQDASSGNAGMEAKVTVRYASGGTYYHSELSDDQTGQLDVPVDDSTYRVSAIRDGYQSGPQTIHVSGSDVAVIIPMTRSVSPPSDGEGCVVRIDVERDGEAAAAKKIWVRLLGDDGVPSPIDEDEHKLTTDANGRVLVELRRKGDYAILELAVRDGVKYESPVDRFTVDDDEFMTHRTEVFFA